MMKKAFPYEEQWPPLIDSADIGWSVAVVALALIVAITGSAGLAIIAVPGAVTLVATVALGAWSRTRHL
jgi:hypothetical protein